MPPKKDKNDGPFPSTVFPPEVFPRHIFPWMSDDEDDGSEKTDSDYDKDGEKGKDDGRIHRK
jgi:hypothetical protein